MIDRIFAVRVHFSDVIEGTGEIPDWKEESKETALRGKGKKSSLFRIIFLTRRDFLVTIKTL